MFYVFMVFLSYEPLIQLEKHKMCNILQNQEIIKRLLQLWPDQ